MSEIDLDGLMRVAREAAAGSNPVAALEQIDAALLDARDSETTGRLLLTRAIALQCDADPMLAADAAAEASAHLGESGPSETAAYAGAAASVMVQRAGEVGRSVELAVSSLVRLAEADPVQSDSLSAVNALAQSFANLSAFELAVEMADRAFSDSVGHATEVRVHYAYSLGYCTVEAVHAAMDPESSWLNRTIDAAHYLESEGSAISVLVAAGFRCEVALLRDDREGFCAHRDHVDPTTAEDPPIYAKLGERLIAWHLLVRASGARRWASPTDAVTLLDRCLPLLEQLGDDHRLLRAMDERVRALIAVGDVDRAAAAAIDMATLARQRQMEQVGHLASQISARADLETARLELRRRAYVTDNEGGVDVVTGVDTRRSLEARLDAVESGDGSASVLFLDLDRFKGINDTFGHRIGDRVLATTGAVLRAQAERHELFVARYGGDEFVLVMAAGSGDRAARAAEELRAAIAEAAWNEIEPSLGVTASVGTASGRASEVRHLLHLADMALYDAKRAGRDRVTNSETSETAKD